MQLIGNGTQVAARPPPRDVVAAADGSGFGWGTWGNPATGPEASIWDPDVANATVGEIVSVVLAAGMALDPTSIRQLLTAIRLLSRIQLTEYATPGTYTYTVPAGVYWLRIRLVGGGGGGSQCATGGGSAGNQSGGGGGAGGYAEGTYAVTPGQQFTVIVGAGGVTQLAGGVSTFGSLIGATGGTGAQFQAASSSAGGVGGLGFGGNVIRYGAPGSDGQSGPLCFAGNGGNSVFGGGGRAGSKGGTVGWAAGAGGGGAYDASSSGVTYDGGKGAAGCVIVEALIGVAA